MYTDTKSKRLIRMPEVILMTGYSRASIYLKIKDGSFPKQHRIGKRAVAFLESDIQGWIDEQVGEAA